MATESTRGGTYAGIVPFDTNIEARRIPAFAHAKAKVFRVYGDAPTVFVSSGKGDHCPNNCLPAVLGAGAPCELVFNVSPNPMPPAAAAAAARAAAPLAWTLLDAMVGGLGGGGGGAGACGLERKLMRRAPDIWSVAKNHDPLNGL
jgi:hypothetical protein